MSAHLDAMLRRMDQEQSARIALLTDAFKGGRLKVVGDACEALDESGYPCKVAHGFFVDGNPPGVLTLRLDVQYIGVSPIAGSVRAARELHRRRVPHHFDGVTLMLGYESRPLAEVRIECLCPGDGIEEITLKDVQQCAG